MKFTKEVDKIISFLPNIHVFDGNNSVDIGRKAYESMTNHLGGKKEPVKTIEEFSIAVASHAIPIRIYRPDRIVEKAKSPAILYLHGGWFISGSLETHDTIARKLANATKAIIIVIDYRLAPEYPFPAGLEDSVAVTNWVFDHAGNLGIDCNKIGIIGDSSGAALACALSIEHGKKLQFQVLIYPAADNTLNTKSWNIYKNGPILSKEGAVQAWEFYLQNEENKQNPLAVPILIKEFKDTPSTLILLAEHDPLHDEGKQLGNNMKSDGITTKVITYKDMIHGFMHMGGVFNETQLAIEEIAAFINNEIK